MSKLLHVLAIIASMHGFGHCPEKMPPDAPPSFDRTIGLLNDLGPLCKSKPHAVVCHGHRGHQLTFAEVKRVDSEYRAIFRYSIDREDQYGDSPYDNWSVCGECTDYALTLSELLAMDGEDGRDMHLVGMLYCDKDGCEGHSRLWVRTSDRGLIEVDNMYAPGAVRWTQGEYESYITMDGRRREIPFPGWGVSFPGTYWRGK